MNKQHFIKHFMESVPVEDPLPEAGEPRFDPERQLLTNAAGELCFESGWYTNKYTSAKYIKGHRSRSNKWIPGRTRPGKQDRRKGK